ncbi:MAG TPA: UrcA family protein [Steroidobacteraceae bacterium]|nr:UrcA family protein [Steroidobacteraceae bacterium]
MTRFTNKMLLAGALGCVTAAGAAFASPVSAPRKAVFYDSAALQTDAGARALYSRIVRAAAEVCPNDFSLLATRLVRECREQAIANAVGKIHNERLAELHAAATEKAG